MKNRNNFNASLAMQCIIGLLACMDWLGDNFSLRKQTAVWEQTEGSSVFNEL